MSLVLAPLFIASACPSLQAAGAVPRSYVVEPDDYAQGAVLNDISPGVALRIHDGVISDGDPRPAFPADFGVFPDPSVIPVTARTNADPPFGYFTSTGTKAFAHAGVGFNNQIRQLAMRFNGTAGQVSIDVIGSSSITATVGLLEVYDRAGVLLESVQSPSLFRRGVATLSISRPAFDIGYALAYSSPDFSQFGRFDNLRFTTVPEPAGCVTCCILVAGVFSLAMARRRNVGTESHPI